MTCCCGILVRDGLVMIADTSTNAGLDNIISMDSMVRSNFGVGMPIDVLVARPDVGDVDLNHRIETGKPYFHHLRSRWSAALRAADQNIPPPPDKDVS